MAKNYATHVGETDADAFELRVGMKPLEEAKEAADILHVETDAIVFDAENYLMRRDGGSDGNASGLAFARKFQGVGNES